MTKSTAAAMALPVTLLVDESDCPAGSEEHVCVSDRSFAPGGVPGDWVGASFTARRCGVNAEVLVSFELWTAIQVGELTLEDVLKALATAGAAAAGPIHDVALGTTPGTIATCVGEHRGKPVLRVKLRR